MEREPTGLRSAAAPSLRARLLVALALAFAVLVLQAYFPATRRPGGDFDRALDMAGDVLAGRDVYDRPYSFYSLPYPLPAALVGLPFVLAGVPRAWSGWLFFALSSGLLAFALTRRGYQRLAIFLALPYWHAFTTIQWAPLVAAAAFYPWLSFLVLVKPQISLPIVVTRLSWTRVAVIAVVAVASLLVLPTWPWDWLDKLGFGIAPDGLRIDRHSQHWYYPLFTVPGAVSIVALTRLRDRDARLLLLASVMPHNMFDVFYLWIIPRDRREIAVTVLCSWITGIAQILPVVSPAFDGLRRLPVGWPETTGSFLPMAGVILWRNYRDRAIREEQRQTRRPA